MTLKVDVPGRLLRGDVDEGYGPVADAFRGNFAQRGEVGAACAVYRDGKKVVDLWGGYRDGETRAEWREDTIVVMFSTTKGVSGLALALAHSRGLLDYDEPVAAYWPEFGWRGKGEITVRQLLSHQAGLPVIDIPLTVADLANPDLVAAAIALQRPLWPPGARHGYHFFSIGWYESELLRRVDPAHRSLGRYFAEEIAAPHGIEFFIGLPAGFDLDRRATIHGRGQVEALRHLGELPRRFVLAMMTPKSITHRAVGNPRELLADVGLNSPDMLAVEIPAGNGIGEPRAVAAAYSTAVTGGLGLTSQTLDALIRPAQPPAAACSMWSCVLSQLCTRSATSSRPRNIRSAGRRMPPLALPATAAHSPSPIRTPGSVTAMRRTASGSPWSTTHARSPYAKPSTTPCSESDPSTAWAVCTATGTTEPDDHQRRRA
jgi:CubicO group peptidase (beta-lactamase class C family)